VARSRQLAALHTRRADAHQRSGQATGHQPGPVTPCRGSSDACTFIDSSFGYVCVECAFGLNRGKTESETQSPMQLQSQRPQTPETDDPHGEGKVQGA